MSDIDDILLNFSPGGLMTLNAILAIVMLSVALDLTRADFARLARAPKPLIAGLISQFIVLPALTFALVWIMAPQPSIALGLILIAACPGGNISNFITARAGGNAALSVSMTAVATAFAVLLTPTNIAFWGGLYPPTRDILQATEISPLRIGMTLSLTLLVPLILGVTLNERHSAVAARIRRPLQNLSMLIFVAFIVIALAVNWSFFVNYAVLVAVLVIMHNTIALAGGYTTATLARLSPYDRRAVTIETGIQNSGLGLVLIFTFFDGLGGMAVVAAFWGIWHAISGIVIAQIMRRWVAAQ